MLLVKTEAKSWVKCTSCGANVRTCEKYLQVTRYDGRPVRGERYCLHCEDVARENNEIDDTPRRGCAEDGDLALREEYAAYQAAGATHAFWSDRDAGYID